ncbi:hypothetical protein [Streptomyces sp. NPDC093109]|uniref:hypothetical protein n=1 Tax=Streptomyces sp. NPDC093109 TaxID=3154977 RepID=UPI0034509F23
MTTTSNVLSAVLAAHGRRCGCEGACGTEHTGRICLAWPGGAVKELLAAPALPYATDTQNAAAPVEELRPWCWPCWRKAVARERDRVANQRRRELDEAQISLFDISGEAA